jgi:hypothetical protein
VNTLYSASLYPSFDLSRLTRTCTRNSMPAKLCCADHQGQKSISQLDLPQRPVVDQGHPELLFTSHPDSISIQYNTIQPSRQSPPSNSPPSLLHKTTTTHATLSLPSPSPRTPSSSPATLILLAWKRRLNLLPIDHTPPEGPRRVWFYRTEDTGAIRRLGGTRLGGVGCRWEEEGLSPAEGPYSA